MVVQEYLLVPTIAEDVRKKAFHHFGRWTQSMLTMYEITLAPGPWGPVGRLLIFKVDHLYWLFFIPYSWLVTFAITRIITAMFLKQTLAAAAGDNEAAVVERMQKKEKDMANIRKVFEEADNDGSGFIEFEEFQAMLRKPRVQAWLGILELMPSDLQSAFT